MAVGFLIPWIPVLAVLALVIVLVVRRKRFRRASGVDASSESASDPSAEGGLVTR